MTAISLPPRRPPLSWRRCCQLAAAGALDLRRVAAAGLGALLVWTAYGAVWWLLQAPAEREPAWLTVLGTHMLIPAAILTVASFFVASGKSALPALFAGAVAVSLRQRGLVYFAPAADVAAALATVLYAVGFARRLAYWRSGGRL